MSRIERPAPIAPRAGAPKSRATALRELVVALCCVVAAPLLLRAQEGGFRFNTVYVCNGQKLVVASCSASGSCIVALPDHRAANGRISTIAVPRANLENRLPSCFMRGNPTAHEVPLGAIQTPTETAQYPVN